MSEDGQSLGGTRALRLHRALSEVWDTRPGLMGRLSAVNHSIVGLRFVYASAAFFAAAGILAMLARTQLAQPSSDFMDAGTYAQVVTLHGTAMMFLFAIPAIEGLALYLLPKILGARDLAFPRLSAFGFWCYLFGGSTVLGSILFGAAPDGGWFMYTPLSSKPYSPGTGADVWLLGITFVEISAIAAAVEIVTTILKVRSPGMSLTRMPLMAWYLLVTALMILGGFPPLILGSILLELERAFGWPFFDPTRGGDPLLWQHLFWMFGHPEVYIIFLPAAGAISTILPVFARRPIVGYEWIVTSAIALGFLSFGLWVHHMFATGLPRLSLGLFSAASLLVAIPTAVQVFAWLATLAKGRPELSLPMLYVLGFFAVFVAGGLTGVMVAVVPFDEQAHGTHFVVAHLHYVLIGGFVFPMLGAAYYWLPHATGRMPVFGLGKAAFWLIFIGLNVTFLVMHWTGLMGMQRRAFTYPADAGLWWPNLISSVGGFVMTAGFALFFLDMFLQKRHGRSFRRDPWRAGTLEWAIPTPPASYVFASLPHVEGRAPVADDPALPARLAAGEGYLGRVREGRMETLTVSVRDGAPEGILVLPNSDPTPLWCALSLTLFFGPMLAGLYWLAPLGLILAAVFAWRWAASLALPADPEPEDAGRDTVLPLHVAVPDQPGWWGIVLLLVADLVAFSALAFGAVFLSLYTADWAEAPALGLDLLGGAALAAAALAAWMGGRGALAIAAAASLAAALLLGIGIPGASPSGHATGALAAALRGYGAIHALIGAILAAFALVQTRRGYVSAVRSLPPRAAALWLGYAGATGIGALALLHVLARAL